MEQLANFVSVCSTSCCSKRFCTIQQHGNQLVTPCIHRPSDGAVVTSQTTWVVFLSSVCMQQRQHATLTCNGHITILLYNCLRSAAVAPQQAIVQVMDPQETVLYSRQNEEKGTFGFTSKTSGDFKACFTTRGAPNSCIPHALLSLIRKRANCMPALRCVNLDLCMQTCQTDAALLRH